jgi:hypothetical protein
VSFATAHGLVNVDGGDQGFHHTGVRPVAFRNPEDLGRASVLTDCRVEKEQAPFDHPSIDVANGPSLPAVGAAGTGTCPR